MLLMADTPEEAVCTVLEKSNTGIAPLDVFELLTATFAVKGFNLKDDWNRRKERLRKRAVNNAINGSDFLQAVTLLATRARRRSWRGSARNAHGASCKRKNILRLTLNEYLQWAGAVTDGFDWAAVFLAQEGIFNAENVPYLNQLVPLAAIRTTLGTAINNHGTIARIHQWYWSGVFGELYDGVVETRLAWDLEEVIPWIQSDGTKPQTVDKASFRSSRLLTLRDRNSAAYKGLEALLIRNGCIDWQKHEPMALAPFYGHITDAHHIFPRAWCNNNGVDDIRRDSIVNMTVVSSGTNRLIGSRAPSEYLPILERHAEISPAQMDKVLKGHAINATALRADNFDIFLRIANADYLIS